MQNSNDSFNFDTEAKKILAARLRQLAERIEGPDVTQLGGVVVLVAGEIAEPYSFWSTDDPEQMAALLQRHVTKGFQAHVMGADRQFDPIAPATRPTKQ
jgi:hypothetical protein